MAARSMFPRPSSPADRRATARQLGTDGKIGLFPLFANITVADVFHDADDLAVRFGVGCGSHSDASAERIASSEISFYKGFVDNHRALPALTHRQRLICRDDIQGIVFVKVSSSDNPGPKGREEPGSDGVHLDLAVGNVSFTSLDRQRITPRSPEE